MDMDSMDLRKLALASGAGGVGAGIASLLFGGKDPSKEAMGYLDQIQGQISPYYNPYINAGTSSLAELQKQYGNLLGDPGSVLNKIGGGYQQSPGFKFALQQALQGAGHAAAAGGMAGSPQHEQQNMGIATGLANQDYNNYLDRATDLFGKGLSGTQGIMDTGFNASKSLSDQIANILAQKAQLSYAGAMNQNTKMGGDFGNLFGGAGLLAAFK